MSQPQSATPDLQTLIGLFYRNPAELGRFEDIAADEMPSDYRMLLAHQNHMTVTVEAYHRSPVDVRVIESKLTDTHYARRILLTRQSDGKVVQFGIVRLNFAHVSDDVRRAVESQMIPLGRILIEHNVLREIHLMKLWKVAPGPQLRELLGLEEGEATYGRTALIDCNGEPAVELLEIVAPVQLH